MVQNTHGKTSRTHVLCQLATIGYHPIHPTEGSIQLYYDQLNIIAKNLRDAYPKASSQEEQVNITNDDNNPIIRSAGTLGDKTPAQHKTELDPHIHENDLGKSFTLKQLKQCPDWEHWKKERYKMLDSYNDQGMFSEPMVAPEKANIHHMLWRYLVKMCGTRKAQMVCDGSPRRGTITLGHTFANSLDSASEHLFWAVCAMHGLMAFGADCSNAFAEAPPPKAPLYMHIDEAYHDWWVNHLKKELIDPRKTVVRVHNAIQGHLESPRLWEKMIDKLLREISLIPTTHEPCLYHGIYKGQYTLFLIQVDDFAIATDNNSTAQALILDINKGLRLPIHILGEVTRYNGMDFDQAQLYVKINCQRYVNKQMQNYPWLVKEIHKTKKPLLPFQSDSANLTNLIHCPKNALTDQECAALE
jgi:hypothetical protein